MKSIIAMLKKNLFLIKNWRSVELQNYLHFFRNVLTVSGKKTYEEVSFVTQAMQYRAERGSKEFIGSSLLCPNG